MSVHAFKPKPSGKRQYKVAAKGTRGEIQLYGPIGASIWSDGITLAEFSADLKALANVATIDIRINSDGGDVFEGRAMYNLLVQHKAKKTVYVDGLAASIASLIAMSGNEIVMGDGAFMMIHQPWGGAVGTADDMRRTADLLDSVNVTLVDTYTARTGMKRDEVMALVVAETWMPADEAVEKGFADKVADGVRVAAAVVNIQAYRNLPEPLRPNRARAQALLDRRMAASK